MTCTCIHRYSHMHAHNKRISILKGDRGKLDNTSAAHQKTHLEKLTLSLACSGLSQAAWSPSLCNAPGSRSRAHTGLPWRPLAAEHSCSSSSPDGSSRGALLEGNSHDKAVWRPSWISNRKYSAHLHGGGLISRDGVSLRISSKHILRTSLSLGLYLSEAKREIEFFFSFSR